MGTATTIPENLFEFPLIITGLGTYRFPRQEQDSPDGDVPETDIGFKILKMCQRPLEPTTVDVYFSIGFEGQWVLDIADCGYENSSGDWFQLKPDMTVAQYGDEVAASADGSAVTFVYTGLASRPTTHHLVWDASDYTGFLTDPDVSVSIVLAPYPTHAYYAFNAVVVTGDNGQGSQTSITQPESVDTEKEMFFTFTKGFTEPPCLVTDSVNGVRFVYSLDAVGICNCFAVCGEETIHALCPDGKVYTLDIPADSVPSADPFRQNVTFQDGLGNQTVVVARSIHNVVPPAPSLTLVSGTQITVAVDYTLGAFSLSDDAEWYRIERYMGSDNNRKLVVDWREVTGTDQVADTQLLLDGFVYGYRVQLMTKDGNKSQWSSWATQTFSA